MNQNLIIPLGAALAAKIALIPHPADVPFLKHQPVQAQFPWGTGDPDTPGYNSDRFISHQGTPLSRKLSGLGTQLEGGSPYLVDWLLSPTSTQRTHHELPGLWLSPYHPLATHHEPGLCHVSL
ncbi:MAG TPA: hypothetical protein V6C65_39390 [Allocoleopsis sp.]